MDPLIMTGNLMGDFMTRAETLNLPDRFRCGYELHLFIDQFTDSHPVVDEFCGYYKSSESRYAPVVADVVMDYFLVKNWNEHYDIDLDLMTSKIYDSLNDSLHLLPDKIAGRVGNMVFHRFIDSYKSLEGIENVFSRMRRRIKKEYVFLSVNQVTLDHESALNSLFNSFYPDLQLATNKKLLDLMSK